MDPFAALECQPCSEGALAEVLDPFAVLECQPCSEGALADVLDPFAALERRFRRLEWRFRRPYGVSLALEKHFKANTFSAFQTCRLVKSQLVEPSPICHPTQQSLRDWAPGGQGVGGARAGGPGGPNLSNIAVWRADWTGLNQLGLNQPASLKC